MSKVFSTSDVASHKTKDDLYIIVDEDVYDLTQFQNEHPGKCTCDSASFKANFRQVDRRVSRKTEANADIY